MGTLYHGAKFAVEALSEALHYELEPLGIRVRIVEPGMINTNFGGSSFDFAIDERFPEYASTTEAMGRVFGKLATNPSEPEMVAEVIWEAANTKGDHLRYGAGSDAENLPNRRKQEDDTTFIGAIKELMKS